MDKGTPSSGLFHAEQVSPWLWACVCIYPRHNLNSTLKPKPFPGPQISYCGQLDPGPSALPVEVLEAALEGSCVLFSWCWLADIAARTAEIDGEQPS